MGVNTVQCTGLWVVPNIPKFKGRANWSRDTVQPMRRRACVYQNIDPVIKHFHNSGRSRTDFKINLQYSSRYHIISKKTFDVREQEYHSLQGIIGVFELPDRTDRRGRGSTDLACKIFDGSKLVMCKNSLIERVWKFVEIVQKRNGTSY